MTSLDGIEQWEGLKTIELFDCPQITSLAPLASLKSLEHISLGLFPDGPGDLSPLTSLQRLQDLSLMGHSAFDVNSLAGIQDLLITVPSKARVLGADKLGPSSHVYEV